MKSGFGRVIWHHFDGQHQTVLYLQHGLVTLPFTFFFFLNVALRVIFLGFRFGGKGQDAQQGTKQKLFYFLRQIFNLDSKSSEPENLRFKERFEIKRYGCRWREKERKMHSSLRECREKDRAGINCTRRPYFILVRHVF